MNRNKCKKNKRRRKFNGCKEIKELGFVMLVFGIITICAFFLPIKAWILLLGAVLLYCGIRLHCNR